jgi:hypothetical protein
MSHTMCTSSRQVTSSCWSSTAGPLFRMRCTMSVLTSHMIPSKCGLLMMTLLLSCIASRTLTTLDVDRATAQCSAPSKMQAPDYVRTGPCVKRDIFCRCMWHTDASSDVKLCVKHMSLPVLASELAAASATSPSGTGSTGAHCRR